MDLVARHNVTVAGPADGQPLVFAHGFGCDQNIWRHVAPAFETTHRVVLFDFVGAGHSSAPYDPEKYADKGADAAVVSALARHTVRALSVTHDNPAEVLEGLNDVLRRFEAERHCTVALATFRPRERGWEVAVAVGGHPPPVLVGSSGPPTPLLVRGSLVGIFPGAEFTDHHLLLEPGQTLLVHTEGITEARGPLGYYGDERLLRTLGQLGTRPQVLVDGLVADAVAFQGSRTRDDIAVVAVGVPEPVPT